MKTTITTTESAKAAILTTFNCEVVDPNVLLENMQTMKNALPLIDDDFKHSAFEESLEILQNFLAFKKVYFYDNPPAWAEKRLNDVFKSISTIACILCDSNKICSPLMRKFIADVIDLANAQLEDMFIDILPLLNQ